MKQPSNTSYSDSYDYLFIGLGAANSLLLLGLSKNGLLEDKTIAIVDPSDKLTNDKTFCFWSTIEEMKNLNLENLVSHSWKNIEIGGITKQHINPLNYYHIKGADLSVTTKEILNQNQVIYYTSIITNVSLISNNHFEISVGDQLIRATKVFDSRPPSLFPLQKNQSHIHQSFLGWKVKTSKPVFDTSSITMMDFKIDQNNSTQFVYVLPFEKDSALIELTRFGEEKITEKEATNILQQYVNQLDNNFDILEKEVGIIPMSSGKLNVPNYGENWINTGTRADLLKCSTGYAFHSMAEDAINQTATIKDNKQSLRASNKKRFAFYDRLLLKILSDNPKQGKNVFETLFKKVPMKTVLQFMRENTTLIEEVSIFSKLPKRLFIGAAIKDIFHQVSSWPILTLPFLFTVISILFSFFNLEIISWIILGIGFLTVGLAHGALDHLTSKSITTTNQLIYFIMSYLFKGVLFALVWWISSDIALILFILYSAWHFGQADFKEWNLKQSWLSFLWGSAVLLMILFFHINEFILILEQIPNLSISAYLKNMSTEAVLILQVLTLTCGLVLSLVKKSKHLFLTLIYLLLASNLSLILAFGIYFVGQHSINGWKHLSTGLKKDSITMMKNALPFTFGGIFILIYFLFFAGDNYIGTFFIILSCLSLPHVFSMHHFYKLFPKN